MLDQVGDTLRCLDYMTIVKMGMRKVIEEILFGTDAAPERAWSQMPSDFAGEVHESIAASMEQRLCLLGSALKELEAGTSSMQHHARVEDCITHPPSVRECLSKFDV